MGPGANAGIVNNMIASVKGGDNVEIAGIVVEGAGSCSVESGSGSNGSGFGSGFAASDSTVSDSSISNSISYTDGGLSVRLEGGPW